MKGKRRGGGDAAVGVEAPVKRTTIADIAKAAGVSVGLVSSFLSGKKYAHGGRSGIRIGKDTAERILEVCRQENYLPDKAAVFNRIYPERAEVAFVGNSLHFRFGRYFMIMLDGIVVSAARMNVKVSVMQFDQNLDYLSDKARLPYSVLEGDIAKYIVGGSPNLSFLQCLIDQGAHVVYVSREIDLPGVVSVVPDYFDAARIAVRYLYNLGHRRIGFMGYSYFKEGYHGKMLRAGAEATLTELKLPWSDADFQFEDTDYDAIHSIALDNFLQQTSPPTAVFCFDDVSAELCLRAAADRSLSVPGDLSIVGCNDERQAAALHPALTTVHLPVYEMGARAVEVVNTLACEGSDAVARKIVLPVYLVERASSAPLGARCGD